MPVFVLHSIKYLELEIETNAVLTNFRFERGQQKSAEAFQKYQFEPLTSADNLIRIIISMIEKNVNTPVKHRSRAVRIFEEWLKENSKSFSHKPYPVHHSAERSLYKFRGVSGRIRLHISRNFGFYVAAMNYDILQEFDVWLKRRSDGKYYCEACPGKYRTYFSKIDDLMLDHCFTGLIKWANGNFVEKNRLIIAGSSHGGWSAAKILTPKKKWTNAKYVRFEYPVLTTKSQKRSRR